MTTETTLLTAVTTHSTDKQRGPLKTKRDEIDPTERLPKPDWIRVKAALPSGRFGDIKNIVRTNKLVTVCEEASCPNIGECWSKGTATFMIMGDTCTRRCRFCNVSTGRPDPLDSNEPERLAQTIALMKLNYVVITSVDRDDLRAIGQYLQPSGGHMPVRRYVHPDTFKMYAEEAYKMGFLHAASGPLVRSSYHADEQAHAAGVF